MNRGVFLDRDGTINEEVGYLHEPERVLLINGAAKAVKRLNDCGLVVICVSNQAGVAKGFYPIEAVNEVNKRIETLLAAEGAFLDGIYFCPHHPTEGDPPYRAICHCRKPSPGMLEDAARTYNIELRHSYLVGDRLTDIQTAQNVGLKGILVLTGYGASEFEVLKKNHDNYPDHICNDLSAAVDWIIAHEHITT